MCWKCRFAGGTGWRGMSVLAAAAAAVVAVSAVAAAAPSPERGIVERAEGADELPAWLTEHDEAGAAAPAMDPGPSPALEPEPPDVAPTTAPAALSATAEPPDEPSAEPEDLAPATTSPPSDQPAPEPSPVPSVPPGDVGFAFRTDLGALPGGARRYRRSNAGDYCAGHRTAAARDRVHGADRHRPR